MMAKPDFAAKMVVRWEKIIPKVVSSQDVGGSHRFTHVAHGNFRPGVHQRFFSTRSFFQVAMQAELKTMDQKVTTLLQWVQEGKVTNPQG